MLKANWSPNVIFYWLPGNFDSFDSFDSWLLVKRKWGERPTIFFVKSENLSSSVANSTLYVASKHVVSG